MVIKVSFVPSLDDQLKEGEGGTNLGVFQFFTFPMKKLRLGREREGARVSPKFSVWKEKYSQITQSGASPVG